MAGHCLASIHLCRIRVTRLDALGNPAAGPNNFYVSDKPISIGVTPVVSQGSDTELRGGCDCIIAQRKGNDLLKRFTLQLDLGVLEPALIEMLTGGDAIIAGGVPIGVWWPSGISCSDAQAQPNVCVEGWQDAWADDQQDATLPYVHWIWPSVRWQIGPHTLQNDFNQPQLNGETRANSQWGTGPFGDLPEAAGPLGGWFFEATVPPTADCQDVAVS
jgi:hypothetical protein